MKLNDFNEHVNKFLDATSKAIQAGTTYEFGLSEENDRAVFELLNALNVATDFVRSMSKDVCMQLIMKVGEEPKVSFDDLMADLKKGES